MLIVLYTLLWFKGNAAILFDIKLAPFYWWLYTGLITNYLGLLSWWFLVKQYEIWGAIAITYILHTIVELSLSFYFFEPPNTKQYFGLFFPVLGSFLVLRKT